MIYAHPVDEGVFSGTPELDENYLLDFIMRITQDVFLKRSRLFHGDRYSYEKSVYESTLKEVIIICHIHGEFKQKPEVHWRSGCPKCGNGQARKKKTTDSFIIQAILVHGHKYDYSSVVYTGNHNKVDIKCPMHGVFKQEPVSHLSGCGCRRCIVAWNKGVKGSSPWNKGVSRFKSQEEYRKHQNELRKLRRKNETNRERIADRIRTLIRNQLKIYSKQPKKGTKTEVLLGCNIEVFRKHLENNFSKGMLWDNYGNGKGRWNIDHIKPVSLFNLDCIEQQKEAFNYKNCQPMWAIDNIKKGAKWN